MTSMQTAPSVASYEDFGGRFSLLGEFLFLHLFSLHCPNGWYKCTSECMRGMMSALSPTVDEFVKKLGALGIGTEMYGLQGEISERACCESRCLSA